MNENNPLVETEIINATQGPEYNDLEPAIKVDEPQLEIEPIPVTQLLNWLQVKLLSRFQ